MHPDDTNQKVNIYDMHIFVVVALCSVCVFFVLCCFVLFFCYSLLMAMIQSKA